MPREKEKHHRKLGGGNRGEVTVFAAPMFAGKSSRLIAEAERFRRADIPLFIVKHPLDDRYIGVGQINSHDGRSVTCEAYADPFEAYRRIQEIDPLVVIWDEVQFYTGNQDELLAVVEKLATEGRIIMLAGLELDFRGEVFGPMGKLMARADKVEKLTAVCAVCGSVKANRTQRLVNGQPVSYLNAVILVGAAETYEARCANCHEVPGAPNFDMILESFKRGV